MRRAEKLITLNVVKENLKRASKESITVIKPGEDKGRNGSCCGFKRKIMSN